MLAQAIAGVADELSPLLDQPDNVQDEFVAAEISGFMRLTCGGWPPGQRQEWCDQVTAELLDVPYSLLLPAVQKAKRTIYAPGRFVSFIFEEIQPHIDRLQAEQAKLHRLASIASEPQD